MKLATQRFRTKKILQMQEISGRQFLGLGTLWLITVVLVWLGGGSFSGIACVIGIGPLYVVIPILWRFIVGKKLLSDFDDFQQECLIPLVADLKAHNIEVAILEKSSEQKGVFEPVVPYKSFESLAQLQIDSHHLVSLIHIGYWTNARFGKEAFYLDFAVKCEVKDVSTLDVWLSMRKHFILFGKSRPRNWMGGELAQLLNQDEMLKEDLIHIETKFLMESPAFWIVANEKEKIARIHIPFVKRPDSEQILIALTVTSQIAHHINSLT